MVYTVTLEEDLSYKQNICDIELMLEDQESTFIILSHAHDIPECLYKDAMEDLWARIYDITYERLYNLVFEYGCK
jgi:hypothetical protein